MFKICQGYYNLSNLVLKQVYVSFHDNVSQESILKESFNILVYIIFVC